VKYLIAAQVLDLVTVLWLISVLGVTVERNPLVRQAYESTGPLGLVALKGGLIALMFYLRPRMRGHWPVVCAMGIGFGVVGAASNLYTLGAS
jgi:hypothetical protein